MSSECLETFLQGRVSVYVGDITQQAVDAIVNAANATLMGGGGVDGAIHRRGGPMILQQCQEVRRSQYPHGLPTGRAVLTSGGHLPARFVIHTVGPIKGENPETEASLLADCYQNALQVAVEHGVETIAFPSISTGAYGYPLEEAAAIASQAIQESLDEKPSIRHVRLVFFSQPDAEVFLRHQQFAS